MRQLIFALVPAGRENRLDLGRQHDARAVAPAIERLDAEPVARGEHAPPGLVVDRERPHPVEAADAVGAPLVVRLQQDLGVAGGAELASELLQLVLQLEVVVDLAVEHDREPPVGALHRLMAGRRQVENRQTPEAEAHRAESGNA